MRVIAVHAQDFNPPSVASCNASEGPAWVHVRPNLRRGAAVAADLLTALGKDLAWHGKGRNEQSDRTLALAWIRAIGTKDIVVSNAQHAPDSALRFLAGLGSECSITTWLLHRAPIRDTTLGLINSLATHTGDLASVPMPVPLAHTNFGADIDMEFPVPAVDFLKFHHVAAQSEEWTRALHAFSDQLDISGISMVENGSITGINTHIARLLAQAHGMSELVSRLRACQLAAWRTGHLVSVDFSTLLPSQELPTTPPARLDQILMRYRQPQRIVVNSLSARGIPLREVQRLTIAEAAEDTSLPRLVDSPTAALATATEALVHLRRLEGAPEHGFLFVQDAKSLATYVTQATADTGINIAGRRVERVQDLPKWLKRLGITVRPLS